jgi:hypothetical protein
MTSTASLRSSVSEQVPAPDPSPATTSSDDGRSATTDRLSGLAARTAAESVWGRRDEPAAPPSAPARTVADASQLRAMASAAPPVAAPAPTAATTAPPAPVPAIGRISRVKASELWRDGSGLAGWLAATPEPLAETLGKPPFEFATTESNILLGTSADQHPVCVVCEVGPSSDEGLGVLLRVAAVQDGGIVAWIAGEIGDVHTAALSWLNRTTAPRFHLVRVTGIRIDGSASAPIFELVARPPRAAAPAPAGSQVTSSDGGAPRTPDGPRRRAEDHLPDA